MSWFMWLIVFLAFFAIELTGTLIICKLDELIGVLRQVRDTSLGGASSLEEMRNSLHCIEADTQRTSKWR
jgi:hypothetical protein